MDVDLLSSPTALGVLTAVLVGLVTVVLTLLYTRGRSRKDVHPTALQTKESSATRDAGKDEPSTPSSPKITRHNLGSLLILVPLLCVHCSVSSDWFLLLLVSVS